MNSPQALLNYKVSKGDDKHICHPLNYTYELPDESVWIKYAMNVTAFIFIWTSLTI